jgi:hypothetical protein
MPEVSQELLSEIIEERNTYKRNVAVDAEDADRLLRLFLKFEMYLKLEGYDGAALHKRLGPIAEIIYGHTHSDGNAISSDQRVSFRKALFHLDKLILEISIGNRKLLTENKDVAWLSESWRTRARSYLASIKQLVQENVAQEALKERIFSRIAILEQDLERNRTRLQSVSELWLGVTESVARGAKNLEPAVKLLEKLGGALSAARSEQEEHAPQKMLPAPEKLGLEEIAESGQDVV